MAHKYKIEADDWPKPHADKKTWQVCVQQPSRQPETVFCTWHEVCLWIAPSGAVRLLLLSDSMAWQGKTAGSRGQGPGAGPGQEQCARGEGQLGARAQAAARHNWQTHKGDSSCNSCMYPFFHNYIELYSVDVLNSRELVQHSWTRGVQIK